MTYPKDSIDYQINMEALREMEEMVPMTLLERSRIRYWVKTGHDLETNPFKIYEPDGSGMNYLKAHRIVYGMAHGFWDAWEFASYIKLPGGRIKHFDEIYPTD